MCALWKKTAETRTAAVRSSTAAASRSATVRRGLGRDLDDREALLTEPVELAADGVELPVGRDEPGTGPQRQDGEEPDEQVVRALGEGVLAIWILEQSPRSPGRTSLGHGEGALPLVVHQLGGVLPGLELSLARTVGPRLVGVAGQEQPVGHPKGAVVGRERVGAPVEVVRLHRPTPAHGAPWHPQSSALNRPEVRKERPIQRAQQVLRAVRAARAALGADGALHHLHVAVAPLLTPSSRSTIRSHTCAASPPARYTPTSAACTSADGVDRPRHVARKRLGRHRGAVVRRGSAGTRPRAWAPRGGARAGPGARSRPGSAPARPAACGPARTRARGTGTTGTRCPTRAGRGRTGTRAASSSRARRSGRPAP